MNEQRPVLLRDTADTGPGRPPPLVLTLRGTGAREKQRQFIQHPLVQWFSNFHITSENIWLSKYNFIVPRTKPLNKVIGISA